MYLCSIYIIDINMSSTPISDSEFRLYIQSYENDVALFEQLLQQISQGQIAYFENAPVTTEYLTAQIQHCKEGITYIRKHLRTNAINKTC